MGIRRGKRGFKTIRNLTLTNAQLIKRIQFFTDKLKIRKQIFVAKNFKEFTELRTKTPAFCENEVFGAVALFKSMPPVIFINLKNSKKQIDNTIVHELIHIKQPKLTEKKVKIETRKFFSSHPELKSKTQSKTQKN